MSEAASKSPTPMRVQLAVYSAGMFANSGSSMMTIIVPLWLVELGHPFAMIGAIIASRSLVPLIMAIPAGALMDRFGARRAMIIFGAIGAAVPLLYPMSTLVWAFFFLQMVAGLSSTMGWMGAQTLVGQIMKGEPAMAGRLTIASRIGNLVGPPLIGLTWDIFGQWGAFLFCSIWGLGVLIPSLMLPDARQSNIEDNPPFSIRDLMPRLDDYTETFRLLRTPAVALIIFASMMGVAGNGIQNSFYVVYLGQIGLTATFIGVLMATINYGSMAGAFTVGRLVRYFNPFTLMILATIGEIVGIALVPLFSTLAILAALALFRGLTGGIAHPMMVSTLSRSVGTREQGKAVALRTTGNRLTGFIVPIVMGTTAELIGVENSFYVIGGILIAVVAAVGLYARRVPELRS
jgi:MFS family permease